MNKVEGSHNVKISDVALTISVRVVSAFVSAFTVFLVIHSLARGVYGEYIFAVTIAGSLMMIADLGLTSSLARSIAEKRSSFSLALRVVLIRTSVSFMIAAMTLTWVTVSNREMVLAMAGVIVISGGLFGGAVGLLPSTGAFKTLAMVMLAQPILELCLVLIALQQDAGAIGVMIASAIAALVPGVLGTAVVFSRLRSFRDSFPEAQVRSLSSITTYGGALLVVTIAMAVFGSVDQWFIRFFHGSEVNAGYGAAWRITLFLALPATAAATVVAPRLAIGGKNAWATYAGWLRLNWIVGCALVAGVTATAPLLAPIALGSEYSDTASLLVAMSWMNLIWLVAPLSTMGVNYIGGAAKRMPAAIVTVMTNIVLDAILVPRFAAMGAVVSTSIALTFYVLFHIWIGKKIMLASTSNKSAPEMLRGEIASALIVFVFAAGIAVAGRMLMDWSTAYVPDSAAMVICGVSVAALVLTLGRIVKPICGLSPYGVLTQRAATHSSFSDFENDQIPPTGSANQEVA